MGANDFERWYVQVLQKLYLDTDAGFVVLLVTLPILERYIRYRCSIRQEDVLSDDGYIELISLFPELEKLETAKAFWRACRHGLLHQLTFFPEARSTSALPSIIPNYSIPSAIGVEADGAIAVHPVLFSKKVVDRVLREVETFWRAKEKSTYNPPMVGHRSVPEPLPSPDYPRDYFGTSYTPNGEESRH